jgi:DNA-binding FadR family transcriptional regulator
MRKAFNEALNNFQAIEDMRFNLRNELAMARATKAPAEEIDRLRELYDDICEAQRRAMGTYADEFYKGD